LADVMVSVAKIAIGGIFMGELYHSSLTALNDVIRRMAEFLPNLVTAVLMLLAGWIVAKIVEKGTSRILRTLRTDQAMERVAITGILRGMGVERSPVELISRTWFWVILALFVMSAMEALRLVYMSQLISRFVSYFPNVLGAAVIFLAGLAVARLLGSSVGAAVKSAGLEYASAVALFVRYFLALIVIIVALAQLGVRTDILTNIVTVLIISLGLALALALGLGSRSVVANILAGAFAREYFFAGQEIQFQGIKGRIVAVGSVGTSVESDGRQVTIPNTLLIENVVE
jgi:small-conductance mechanosensitive channel